MTKHNWKRHNAFSFSYQEVPTIAEDMDGKTKAQNLGEVIVDFKRDLKYLQEVVKPGTLPKKYVE